MPDPRWSGPPEVIAATFEAGSPASVIANNAAWTAETSCHETVMGLSAVNTAATAAAWQGLGAVSSTTAVLGLNAALQTLAAWTMEKIALTQAAVDAFIAASSSVIPAQVCQLNRDEWVAANATNFFGIRTPEIVGLDSEYFGEHWPHNSSVGWAYSAALGTLCIALALPPPIAPVAASPAGPAAAGEAVAEAAAQTGMNDALQLSNRAAQSVGQTTSTPAATSEGLSALIEPLQQGVSGVLQPLTTSAQTPMQGLAGMPQAFLQTVGGMFPTAAIPEGATTSGGEPALRAGEGAGRLTSGTFSGASGVGAYPGAGLTSYTRPASSFEPPVGGRPTGLRSDLLGAAAHRSPTTSPAAGSAMPMTPAGPSPRGDRVPDKRVVARAHVAVDADPVPDE
ncbi:hypothetical protein A5707_11270 [Mycobacterium kyorinense]|uniref:PPE domain-containing protein n=1 Tax=Mycobacterium kyorinense TaxID=487514 RepID=A0A1A2ZVG5_9MYCO|nr:PPE domain-containing protein [Mycobacterium kyorinense]OBI53688.1 hypothetical protein A5707_11270 [Mycobacterium kyorinense]